MHPPWNVTQMTLGFNLSTSSLLLHTRVFLITSKLLQVNNICKGATFSAVPHPVSITGYAIPFRF